MEKNSPSEENNDNTGLISAFRANIYRHLFISRKSEEPEKAEKWLTLSIKERKSLLRTFDKNAIDTKIYRNFEMEYYLNSSEYLDYYNKDKIDDFDNMMYLSDIDSFVENYENSNNTNAFIQKIINLRGSLN